MQKLQILLYTSLLCAALLMAACTKDKAPVAAPAPECADTISFTHQIGPMLENNCISCHNSGNPSAGYNFTTYESVAEHAAIILSAIRHDGGTTPMPQNMPALPDSIVQQFDCWVAQGKQNN